MFKKVLFAVLLLAAAIFVMTACRGEEVVTPAATPTPAPRDATPTPTPVPEVDIPTPEQREIDPFGALNAIAAQFNYANYNPNPPIEGGTLRWGFGSTRGFQGIFCPAHGIWAEDSDISNLFLEPLVMQGVDFRPVNDSNLANVYFDREERTVTFVKMHESVWADGVPKTLADLVFAHYVIAHPDYQGPRWGAPINNVYGINEYRDGEADHIAGLELSDCEMILTIRMVDFPPTIEQFGFWSSPMPRHHWEGIPVGEMQGHANARHNVLGSGPFVLYSMVEAESVHVVRNDLYWRGPAYLDAITVEIIPPLMLPMAMQEGLFDIGHPFPQSQFTPEFRYMDNVQFLTTLQTSNSTSFMGFRSGTFCPEEEIVITFPEEEWRVSRPVRQALMLTIDHVTAGELFNGLVVPNGSIYFGLRRMEWIDQTIETWNGFDPERAMQILDEAGYDQFDSDGMRLRPDGTPLTIIYLASSGTPANETNRALEIQNWADIGLRVEFYQGRLVEGTVSSDVITYETDGGIVDMMGFGWSWGASPNPIGVFGPETRLNRPRYTSEHWDYLFERFASDDMWDDEFLRETVYLWQHAVSDSGVIFPTTLAITLTAVNNRVGNFSLYLTGSREVVSNWNARLWYLTDEEAIVDSRGN